MRLVSLFLLFLIGMMATVAPASASALTGEQAARKLEAMDWYTEEYPPYNFMGKDGAPTGMAVDILQAALKKIGANIPSTAFKIVPWNQGYKKVQRNPGTVLFSMTYTPERQQIMKFVGPSIPVRVSIIVPRGKNIKIKSAADLSTLSIGVVRDDIGDQLIRKFALSDDAISKKTTLVQLSRYFVRGRVDAIAYATSVFSHVMRESGRDPSAFEEAYVLKEGQLGYAFHNDTPREVLAPLQRAIDELRRDGEIEKIISRYQD